MKRIESKKLFFWKSIGKYRMAIGVPEVLQAMEELTTNAFKLLIYFYTKDTGWTYNEEHVATSIGVNVRSVRRLKKELIDKEYLLIFEGERDVYVLGLEQVNKQKGKPLHMLGEKI